MSFWRFLYRIIFLRNYKYETKIVVINLQTDAEESAAQKLNAAHDAHFAVIDTYQREEGIIFEFGRWSRK